MLNFPDINPDDLNGEELTPEDKVLLNEYNSQKKEQRETIWSVFKAKEAIEKDYLSGILKFLRDFKFYTKEEALQKVLSLGRKLKFSKESINQFLREIGNTLFGDY